MLGELRNYKDGIAHMWNSSFKGKNTHFDYTTLMVRTEFGKKYEIRLVLQMQSTKI